MALDSGRLVPSSSSSVGMRPFGIALEELRRAGLALVDVHVGPVVFLAELRQQQAHLVAVARVEIVVEMHGASRVCLAAKYPANASGRDSQGFSLRLSYSCSGMARRLPPLNALRAFEASARLGSFVAAATELRVSPAAVSQQVRRLEEYLDTTLFQRLARGLTLTDQGRDYLPELSAGFDLLGESTARVRAKRADGVLTLTTLAAFANGWLLPRMHRFRERAPRIDVVLRTSRQVMDFRRDAIDLAIRFAPSPGRGLHGELLSREELFPVASPQLFRRRPRSGHAGGARRLSAAA